MIFPRLLTALAVLSAVNAQIFTGFQARSVEGTDRDDDLGRSATFLLRQSNDTTYPTPDGATMWANTNPRTISNTLMAETTPILNDRDMLDMVWQWGQFLDHDIDLTEGGPAWGNITITIPIDNSDPFIIGQCPEMNIHRSEWNIHGGIRQQINDITSFIDGSNVYGAELHRVNSLREMDSCFMKTSAQGRLLPKNFGLDNAHSTGNEFFVAGDIRANEQVGLTALHTLFVREHNKLCIDIGVAFPGSDADDQFELARKIVGAEIQAITYQEFLPALLGSMSPDFSDYNGYDDSVNPSISNEFATAAYRFGHTMLPSQLKLANAAGEYGSPIELKDVFFSADFFDNDPNLIDHIIGGLQEGLAQEIDPIVTDAVRNSLFGSANGAGTCLDLAVLNIQRGRDHGIPTYNDLRDLMGLGKYTSFSEMTDDVAQQAALNTLYSTVDNVDAWVGMLAEKHVAGSSVGELLGTMLRDQFTRLRDGDPFFYRIDTDLDNNDVKTKVLDITTVTLQKIITRNTIFDKPDDESAFVKGLKTPEVVPWPLTSSRTIEGIDRADGKGAAGTLLARMAPVSMMSYTDTNGGMHPGPNPRIISNVVFGQNTSKVNSRGMLDMVWQWGQFVDHDIGLTEGDILHGFANITVPDGVSDPFLAGNCPEIIMGRSDFTPDAMAWGRQQKNEITSFVDASNVYGSEESRADKLRTGVAGKLKMSLNGLLPKNEEGIANAPDTGANFFLAGDIRANEQPGLTALHTIFVREHNRLADAIVAEHPFRMDEEIYQLARKCVGAEMQKITYEEFLPALLGTMAPDPNTYSSCDVAGTDPSIANEFSTFAFRVGHTMLSGDIQLANSQGPFGSVKLRDIFFDPTPFDNDHFFIDHITGGLMEQLCQEIDASVVDDIRNHLFGDADGPGSCLDLVTLNIQRGRDHGIPLYNDMREMMNLTRYSDFEQITSDSTTYMALRAAYNDDINDVDAWVGGLAEDHVAGASVGQLVGSVIKKQFENLMCGDPFFYKGDTDLMDEDLQLKIMNIDTITLQEVITQNTNIDHDPSVSAFLTDAPPQLQNFPLTQSTVRSYDGTDRADDKGSANTPLIRMEPDKKTYTDPSGGMFQGTNAREISNAIFKQSDSNGNHVDVINPRGLLDMVWQWGQFLDHDIGLTDGDPNAGAMTINIPMGDYFETQGCTGISFTRSLSTSVGGTREQINEITSFIDGSGVYGSDQTRANALRTFQNGELKTSQQGLNLPYNIPGEHNAGGNQNTSFLAGDIRANEQIGLIAMHTLWVREHNRLADLISDHYPGASDEDIYQLARKLVTAQIQIVTYKEFLPALMGDMAPEIPTNWAFNVSKDPSIANEFSGALYRFGHSMISPQLLMSIDGITAHSNMSLASSFFSPEIYLSNPYTTDMCLGGLMLQDAQAIDTKVIDNLRMFLFQAPDISGCMDLVAFNIQRGRDHGIPDYNDLREKMGLLRYTSFEEITFDKDVQAQLSAMYSSVDDIEAWVGALAEKHIVGGNVGELLAHVMNNQFDRLMYGDRMFWLGDSDLQDAELKQYILDVDTVTLAKVIDLNTILDRDPAQSAFVRGNGGSASKIPLTSNRTYDGSDREDSLGMSDTPLMRLNRDNMTYTDDGATMPSGPNVRDISDKLMKQTSKIFNGRGMTDMVWQWGQFVDHDISLTEGAKTNGEFNITLAAGDFMAIEGCPHINFHRSHYTTLQTREQLNEITSFLDASMVYGSDEARAAELRTLTNGEMKTSANGLSLPYNTGNSANAGGSGSDLFLAGDIRVNEQNGLVAIHTLFVREHNRLADVILGLYPQATDEEVYQLARKIVGAEIQKITYDEFLPALLGPHAPTLDRATFAYDDSADPRIANEFSTAIFRMGHTMVSHNIVTTLGPLSGPIPWAAIDLKSNFFNVDRFDGAPYTTDQILGGIAFRKAQEVDLKIVDDIRDFLLSSDTQDTQCLDLGALNIQRGRDHGIPLYNDLRVAMGLPRKNSFAAINPALATDLSNAYTGGVDTVDAWVGALAEEHLTDASVGELIMTVMKDQFERLAYGDPFFYLGDQDVWDPEVRAFIVDIEDITLAKIMDWNTMVTRDPNESVFRPTGGHLCIHPVCNFF